MIAVRPPEYFPRPSYFALMDAVDVFVLADTFQYSRQSFQNRARLRTPDGWQWISIPLKGGQHGLSTDQVEIRTRQPWIGKHRRALHFNYRTTPFFEFYEADLAPVFDADWRILSELALASIERARDLLRISTPVVRSSELLGRPDSLNAVLDQFAGEELTILDDTAEVDGPYASSMLKCEMPTYRQNFEGFEPGMSVLDVLFNYGPDTLGMIRDSTGRIDIPVS